MKKLFFIKSCIVLFFILCTVTIQAKSNEQKPYTIMIYMNGSDLESEHGLATDDLVEIIDSGLDSRNANVLILTGGAKRWMNDAIPEYECIIWQFADGKLNEVDNMGKVNMGNPTTLSDFINFSRKNYPADKYGLIMWDHGGGSIAGFGHDEKFADGTLTLLDMQKAFIEAGLEKDKLEFLGFDACLMATVEMAVLASNYSQVLIASEDLAPGDGWDYRFLSVFNKNPKISGIEVGKVIVDTFIDFYGQDSDEILTMSVIDLTKVAPVMEAMGDLMSVCKISIHDRKLEWSDFADYRQPTFHDLAIRRKATKTFGEGSPRDNYSDMVDIGDMAYQLADLFPKEAATVIRALTNCVVYNRHNSDVELHGLSTFYIFGGKSQGEFSLDIYSNLDMNKQYTEYLFAFFEHLKNPQVSANYHTQLALWQPHQHHNTYRMAGLLQLKNTDNIDIANTALEYLWPTLAGEYIAMFPIVTTANMRQYAIPVQINGRDADIIVAFTPHHSHGKILGIRNRTGNVIQKGYFPIYLGDKIAVYSLEWNATTNTEDWILGSAFTVTRLPLHINWDVAPEGYSVGLRYS